MASASSGWYQQEEGYPLFEDKRNSSYGGVQTPRGRSASSSSSNRPHHSKFVTVASAVALICTGAMFGALVVLISDSPESFEESSTVNAQEQERRLPWYSQVTLPKKVAVDYVTPRKLQMERGTCWDFSTMGVLEQSYRANGIENGWLDENEYVAFSEQAYGKLMIDVCNNPDAKDVCRTPGDEVSLNSTEGGEVPYLYYLADLLSEKVLPHAVCPYFPADGPANQAPGQPDGGSDRCAGYEAAIASNPLKFRMEGMRTMYEPMEIKAELMSTRAGRAMAFSTSIPITYNFYPCVGARASLPECDPASPLCEPCPSYYTPTACCVSAGHSSANNLDGEFFATPIMQIEGGHAMTLVGYNDNFRTRDGNTGGFIIKNSWFDGEDRGAVSGSHSIDWWMQEVSDWDERKVCPNSFNPASWYACGNTYEVTMGGAGSRSRYSQHARAMMGMGGGGAAAAGADTGDGAADDPTVAAFRDCISEETVAFAKLNLQPLKLRCIDGELCDARDSTVYYSKNTTAWGDGFTKQCFFQHDTSDPAAPLSATVSVMCLPPLLEHAIVRVIRPAQDEVRPNDPDRCGFYFMPYEVVYEYVLNYQGFFVNSFEVKWHPRSYLANAKYYGGINYEGGEGGGPPLGSDPWYSPGREDMKFVEAEVQKSEAMERAKNKREEEEKKEKGGTQSLSAVKTAQAHAGFKDDDEDDDVEQGRTLDYSLIRASTMKQRKYYFGGPFPNAKVLV